MTRIFASGALSYRPHDVNLPESRCYDLVKEKDGDAYLVRAAIALDAIVAITLGRIWNFEERPIS